MNRWVGLTLTLISRAFILFASGQHTKQQVLDIVTELGLTIPATGKPLSPQTFDKLLRNPIYVGRIVVPNWGLDVMGRFEPLVDEEVFERCQARITGSIQGAPKPDSQENGSFPLRVFVRCASCGAGLTGSFSTSRSGKKYAYYFCRTKGCRAVKFPREGLHDRFFDLLASMEPKQEIRPLFKEIVMDVWRKKAAEQEDLAAQVRSRIDALEARRQRTTEALIDGKLEKPEYETQMRLVGTAIEKAQAQLSESLIGGGQLESPLAFADWFLSSAAHLWQHASATNKKRLQSVILPARVVLSAEGFGTGASATFYRQVAECGGNQENLASPGGFEPPLPP